ncbi:Hypothetical protein GbCGDNIH9_8301 [Granulibacter bethesdensis]|uniref:Uncharacterized protein n=1 Tax=Granulibacter bethesdensis TaxID=364410 RepID=A0AAC9K834_9PROT|nr:Hypothetical protein GbCGDNIH9_8301 [Granulibacter bethesdensis]APH62938.1 Hypothetical protein GbCGDNIH8_8680 [Granulibacter bethesdensis]
MSGVKSSYAAISGHGMKGMVGSSLRQQSCGRVLATMEHRLDDRRFRRGHDDDGGSDCAP